MLRKVVAFIGLLGVIYALALQHGLFDRADAAPLVSEAQPQSQPEHLAATAAPAPRHSANTKATAKCAKGSRQKCN